MNGFSIIEQIENFSTMKYRRYQNTTTMSMYIKLLHFFYTENIHIVKI